MIGFLKSRPHLILLASLFLCLPGQSHAVKPYTPVHPDPVLETWRWRSFPELNGLNLQYLTEDTEGNMWFGIEDGAMCYDGLTWTHYTEAEGIYGSPVTALCSTRDASVYAGTAWGISRFVNDKWERVFPQHGDIPWPVGQITEVSDGTIWIGTGWGALHLGKKGSTLYTIERMALALEKLMPDLQIHIVPDEMAYTRTKESATDGIDVIEGEFYDIRRRHPPNIVWHVAPGSAGEAAGVQVGDRILKINGDEPRWGEKSWVEKSTSIWHGLSCVVLVGEIENAISWQSLQRWKILACRDSHFGCNDTGVYQKRSFRNGQRFIGNTNQSSRFHRRRPSW